MLGHVKINGRDMIPLRNGQFQCLDCGAVLGLVEAAEHGCVAALSQNDRGVLLDEAGALIDGQRARDYGDAAENFERIAAGWSEIVGKAVSPAQVALCMDWVKTCRLIASPDHRDSWVDKIGYSALGGEIAL